MRWDRRVGFAVAALVAVGGLVGALGPPLAGASGDGAAVVVSDGDGDVLADVPLGGDRFAVRYRNSIYGTLAEERYRVDDDGRFTLVALAADQLAVLEEYYAVPAPTPAPRDDRRSFVAAPAPGRAPTFTTLSIAATRLGERTLLVPGRAPVALWQLVDDDPTIVLRIEEAR